MIHQKKGGTLHGGYGLKERKNVYVGYLILRKPHYC